MMAYPVRLEPCLRWLLIQNGIRFTGMPGFGDVETPDHVCGSCELCADSAE